MAAPRAFDHDNAVRLYERGRTVREISTLYGVAYDSVRAMFRRRGIALGRDLPRFKLDRAHPDVAEAMEPARAQGMSIKQIAERAGYSAHYVRDLVYQGARPSDFCLDALRQAAEAGR